MDDEMLILLVQANECIYDKYNPNYKNKEKKNSAWEQIAQEMACPVEMCLTRWSTLRDRYVREKRDAKLPSGSGSKFKYPWPLMSSMEFIAPHITSRPMRSSKNILDSMRSSGTSSPLNPRILSPLPESSSSSSLFLTKSSDMDNSLFITSKSPIPTQMIPLENDLVPIAANRSPAVAPKRKGKSLEIFDADEAFSDALGSFKKLCELQQEKEKEEESNPLHGFGKIIIATIGSMSSAKQVQAMQRVTMLVMEIKLEPDNAE